MTVERAMRCEHVTLLPVQGLKPSKSNSKGSPNNSTSKSVSQGSGPGARNKRRRRKSNKFCPSGSTDLSAEVAAEQAHEFERRWRQRRREPDSMLQSPYGMLTAITCIDDCMPISPTALRAGV